LGGLFGLDFGTVRLLLDNLDDVDGLSLAVDGLALEVTAFTGDLGLDA
jgi:hypothetical protein